MPATRKATGKLAASALAAALASLALAACGGSSHSSSTASTATGRVGPPGRFAVVRECLSRAGINLPPRTRPGGELFLAPRQLPKGVTRAQYEAALKKCRQAALRTGATARLRNPAVKAELSKFTACMREHGVNLPAPNTSGNGPIFNTRGINTRSASFLIAARTCRPIIARPRAQGGAAAPGA